MTNITPATAEKIIASNREVHRKEADIYDSMHSEIFGSHEQRRFNSDLESICRHFAAGAAIRVLDLGCGTGNLTLKYLRRGFSVQAVDLSPEMIGRLRAKIPPAQETKVEIVVADAMVAVSDPESLDTYDLISFSSVLHHLPDYQLVLQRAMRRLKPGGFIWVCHEPLQSPPFVGGFLKKARCKARDLLDAGYVYARKSVIYAIKTIRTRHWMGHIDYSFSDYHAIHGIDTKALLEYIKLHNGEVLSYTEHRSRYWPLIAALDSRWPIASPNQFGFIVRRRNEA